MKATRQTAILDIIASRPVETQDELAAALRDMGYSVTQATISRDIRELRLIKLLCPDGTYRYATPENGDGGAMNARYSRILSESVLSVNSALNQVVIRTLTGSANVACEALDSFHWPEVIGTLAGDNTILMVIRSVEDVPAVLERIRVIMKQREGRA